MNPLKFSSIRDAADWVDREFPSALVMAAPLGLGKPNQLINDIYLRFKAEPRRKLNIFTALSLEVPRVEGDMARRFFEPFRDRHWGGNYPELEYVKDLASGGLPQNIEVFEFYVQAGKAVSRADIQRHYISVNYTHAPRAVQDQGVQLIVQLIAQDPARPGKFSLSCNPDITADIKDLYQSAGRPLRILGVVHPDLPYCGGDAEVDSDFFDAIVESKEVNHQLFALPRQPIRDADYLIGLQASLLIKDGGTLQIGIGSLSEALVYCTDLRQRDNKTYREIAGDLLKLKPWPATEEPQLGRFETGLYGTSEMIMDGFMHLHRAGILKREVHDFGREVKRYLHGAFFLGSKDFYQWLRDLHSSGDRGLGMTRVSKVNDLYDADELAIRRQRVKARFFNTCMNATLLGGAASDTRETGEVVSGVGGQYNFVAMSHELPDAHSVLMLRASREEKGRTKSNVVWGHGQLTIPRHLRDVVISEYGVAFLRNRTDEETVKAMLNLADKRFIEELRSTAVAGLKLETSYRTPSWTANNHEGWSSDFLKKWRARGLFPAFPYGSDFTPVEERLALALQTLKRASQKKSDLFYLLRRGLGANSESYRAELARMGFSGNGGLKEAFYRRLLLGALEAGAREEQST